VTNLPALVDSVFFGVTHNEHTSYCYSNCNADFYFYRLTSPWDEMALIQSNLPSEDSTPFFGPLNITFPNDFKNQEYDITSAYNYWKTPGNNNYGFTVYSPTVGCNNAAVIFNVQSSDDTVASARPYLKIYYRFPAAVNETENSMDVNVFPNPFHDALKVDIQNPDKIFISDITGRIFNLPFEPSTNKLNTKILNPGIYILHIEKDDKIYNSKVLKK
jgi:hypothetical protein